MTRTKTSSGTTVLIVLLIVFTFPIWIGLLGGLFGLVAGLIGAAIGIVAAVFGAIFGIFGAVIGGIFGGSWPASHFGLNIFLAICLVLSIVALSKARRNKA
jgi:hypothetical protein